MSDTCNNSKIVQTGSLFHTIQIVRLWTGQWHWLWKPLYVMSIKWFIHLSQSLCIIFIWENFSSNTDVWFIWLTCISNSVKTGNRLTALLLRKQVLSHNFQQRFENCTGVGVWSDLWNIQRLRVNALSVISCWGAVEREASGFVIIALSLSPWQSVELVSKSITGALSMKVALITPLMSAESSWVCFTCV